MKLLRMILICTLGLATANPAIADESVAAAASTMHASWYGPGMTCHHVKGKGCVPLTASGLVFNMNDPNIVAHKTLPFGTKLLLNNPKTGAFLVVIVQDRGPFVKGRDLDVTKAGAKVLGFYCGPRCGTAKLVVTRLN